MNSIKRKVANIILKNPQIDIEKQSICAGCFYVTYKHSLCCNDTGNGIMCHSCKSKYHRDTKCVCVADPSDIQKAVDAKPIGSHRKIITCTKCDKIALGRKCRICLNVFCDIHCTTSGDYCHVYCESDSKKN